MTKSIVFVLHGIGQHTAGWINSDSSAVPVLREAAKSYPFFDGKTLDSYVEFVPILYDDIFERILKTWSDLGKGLSASIPVMPGFADKVVQYLGQADKNNWWLKTGCDVLLYWGFRLFQQRVILRVLAQITGKVAATIAAGDEVPHYHVLAHSLGTAVAHDSLYHLGTEDWLDGLQKAKLNGPDAQAAQSDRDSYVASLDASRKALDRSNPFDPSQFAFDSITMLANVTGLIHNAGADPYNSIVRPGTSADPGAMTANYINVKHKFDPIAAVGDFHMPAAWTTRGGYEVDVDHLVGSISKIHEAANYVRHPDVHLRLLGHYVAGYQPTAADLARIGEFEKKYGYSALSAGIEQDLQDLLDGKIGPMAQLVRQLKGLAS